MVADAFLVGPTIFEERFPNVKKKSCCCCHAAQCTSLPAVLGIHMYYNFADFLDCPIFLTVIRIDFLSLGIELLDIRRPQGPKRQMLHTAKVHTTAFRRFLSIIWMTHEPASSSFQCAIGGKTGCGAVYI